MVPNAEKMTGAVWSTKDDPRITKIGNFLRKTAIDEIPQLINIFKGEMSFVGPRAERPELHEEFSRKIPNFDKRLEYAIKLSKTYPDNPKVQLALTECMHDSCDINFIKQNQRKIKILRGVLFPALGQRVL